MRRAKKVVDLKNGDVIIDAAGRPLFEVDYTWPAKARGYRVIFGLELPARRRGQTSYHQETVLTIEFVEEDV